MPCCHVEKIFHFLQDKPLMKDEWLAAGKLTDPAAKVMSILQDA